MSWRTLGLRWIVASALLGAWLTGGLSVAAAGEDQDDEVMGALAEVAGCAECHDLDRPGFRDNPHGVLNEDPALARRLGVSSSCSACHGDSREHAEAGGGEGTIFAFGAAEPARSEPCLDCHGTLAGFRATRHSSVGLACTDCHSIHGDDAGRFLLATPSAVVDDPWSDPGEVTTSCAGCHQEVVAEFELNERHRLERGILDCASCHDPHEPERRTRLAGFGDDRCVDCHTGQGGPFVFEHGAQRVDGCGACHEPHGSANRRLLTFQRIADLCYSCHMVVPTSHFRFSTETVCTNCHSTIHGSNFDVDFLR